MTERSMTIRERALRSIGALAGFGPLTKIGVGMDTRPLAAPPSDATSASTRVFDALRRHEDPARPLQSARDSDPDTSHEAATRIATTISDTQKLVLDFIRSRGALGCTDLDIQRRFGNHGSTYRTRRAELTALELVRDSGVRVTQDGGRRIVWVAVDTD